MQRRHWPRARAALTVRLLVVTEHGKPVAVLLPLVNADLETVSLSSSPRFLELIERSRLRLAEEGAVSPEDVRRQMGI
jgi:hypothetical protein